MQFSTCKILLCFIANFHEMFISMSTQDVQAGLVMFEGIFDALQASMRGLIRPVDAIT